MAPWHALASGVIENVTVSMVYPELVMVWTIFPVPLAANPVRFGELADAVQLYMAPATDDEN